MKKIALINQNKFLIQSVLPLSRSVNLLGFWEKNGQWEPHVSQVTLSVNEYNQLIYVEKTHE